MKKLLPVIALVAVLFFGYKMLAAGTLSPVALIAISIGITLAFSAMRPKNNGPAVTPDAILELLGDFGKDAFSDESQESKEFQTIVAHLLANMPKAALAKLEKLAPKCRNNQETYAVALLTAYVCTKLDDYKRAIHEYNRAIVLNPTSDVAMKIGSAHQRLGQLKKARDSYEFAIELDPTNIPAMSALATAWVADGKYDDALDYAEEVLKLDETNSSALATCAICHGLLNHPQRCEDYTEMAVREGYSRKKIEETIKALKK